MKILRMKQSGRRVSLSDRKAAVYLRLKIAREEPLVIKRPLPVVSMPDIEESSPEESKIKPGSKRRYRRRDMERED